MHESKKNSTFVADMRKYTLFITALVCMCVHAQTRYVGGDISMLPKFEEYSSGYKDVNGQKINDLILWFVDECKWNTFRVRIFVDPKQQAPDYKKTDYAICQDLAYVKALGKRIKDAGAYFLLDFHYSDSWVDAGHIQAPAAWKGLSDSLMADTLGKYTREVLTALKEAGATPDLVQVGNEIMYGLCGIQVHPYNKSGDNWDGYLGLLRAGCNAVREVCPEAQIIIHTDRPSNSTYNKYYYQKLIDGEVDYDIIGLSYYPFWHGYLTDEQVKSKQDKNNLVKAVKQLAVDFPDKRVHIVECAYNFQYWPTEGVNYDTRDVWPCSKQGQYNFVNDLVYALKPLSNVDGISYWYPEDLGNGDYVNWDTKEGLVEETWSNRGFWNENASTTGHSINRTAAPSESKPAYAVCAPYYMQVFYHWAENITQTPDENLRGCKSIENNSLVIRVGEAKYNVLGQRLD